MIIALQTLIFFRESLLSAIDRLLRPYYSKFSFKFNRNGSISDDEESEEQVFSEFDDERGVVFYPPMYAQRYAAVSDCLMDERWCGKLEKVVDLGYHDISFIKYLKEVQGIKCILGVDLESIPLRCSSDLLRCDDYIPKRENPLQITLFQGNAADPDFRLIGCDAVIAIEMIEHMLPHDLDRLVHTVFSFIKPWVVIVTTPNADFNVLFKALERNGLRRLDHFFEWSREQFHDWCSNIVIRYPEYAVLCKGIGPGPPGTQHLGCCSQMAVFTAKDYHKQQDLNLNSLALVADPPSPHLSDMISSWECTETLTENNMLCPPDNFESYTELLVSDKQSRVTIIIATPSLSLDTLEYHDRSSQCNLDNEVGKNFLMFDDEQMCFNVLVPRRKNHNRVYDFEDVNSRLNCTTLQVRKFSKTTQNVMAKNKLDSLVHTREVVDEIRHLTKMLNFKNSLNQPEDGSHVWSNINWGDNAPYWNQYYKIVREYKYPFETKSDDTRILDLISDEINIMIDTQYDDEFSVDVNKLEIPVHYLMRVVEHITDDVDKVKDLLEWNGYVIEDDVVIHSRLVVDRASVGSREDNWHEDDTFSDMSQNLYTLAAVQCIWCGSALSIFLRRVLIQWDATDVHSTSQSDGSTIVQDYNGRCLRRTLDQKVRKLRTMLIGDEDITAELDRVVCRLMKLALRTSRGRQTPLPPRWMQCKLLDLLTLTEKAIERRKRHFIATYPVKAIGYDQEDRSVDMIALQKIREDDTAKKIEDKYQHLVQPTDTGPKTVLKKEGIKEDLVRPQYRGIDLELEDDLSVTSTEFLKDFEHIDRPSPSLIDSEQIFNGIVYAPNILHKKETTLDRTQAWVEEDIEVVSYPNHDINFDNSSGDTDHSTSNIARLKYGKSKKHNNKNIEGKSVACKKSQSKHHKTKHDVKNKDKGNQLKKKATQKNHSYNNLFRSCSNNFVPIEHRSHVTRSKRRHSNAAKPIPESLINLCHPEIASKKNNVEFELTETSYKDSILIINQPNCNVAATEESFFIDIVMDDMEETIALRRTIGTDADVDPIAFENETLIKTVSNEMGVGSSCEKLVVTTENIQSQTIFLNYIDEPSTSKGIRHVSMDVQCGPDVTPTTYSMLSATTSLTRTPKMFTKSINIGDSCTDVKINSADFGTSTISNDDTVKMISPRMRSVGIRIRDSEPNVCDKVECSSMSLDVPDTQMTVSNNQSFVETKLLKPMSSALKIEDSDSELYGSPIILYEHSLNPSAIQIQSSDGKEVGTMEKITCKKYVRPELCCGGVYVHSFRDKYESEDVVYQGEWQRYRPNSLTRRKPYKPIVRNKITGSVIKIKKHHSKEKLPEKKTTEPKIKVELKKPLQMRKTFFTKPTQETDKIEPIPKVLVSKNVTRLNRSTKNATKVASKLELSTISSKITKPTYCAKRPTILAPVTAAKMSTLPSATMKKDVKEPQKSRNKNDIPLYIRRRNAIKSNTQNKDYLNQSIDTVQTSIKINEVKATPPIVRAKTEEINKDLLKFNNATRGNITYTVFHNELENNSGTSGSQSNTQDKLKKNNCTNKRPHSPQSLNSSTCSSPNSVATVRAVSRKPKNLSNRGNASLSHKSNLKDSGSENTTPTRNKKFPKRCKNAKKGETKESDNKENIPDTTTKSNQINKENDKFGKSAFMINHKSVFMAHLKTDGSSLQTTVNNFSKYTTPPNKSNVRNLTVENTAEKLKANPFVSRKMSLNSENSCLDEDTKNKVPECNSDNSNMVHVFEPQAQATPENTEDLVPVKIASNNILTEWMDSSNKNVVDRHTNSILNVMRQFVEQTLDFIDNDMTIDSETVILSRDDMNSGNDDSLSPTSFNTVITNEDTFNSCFENDIENALNRTFDTTLGDESILSLTDTRLTLTDADLLSFKSITSISKYSEYYLADNEFNSQTPITSSVLDLFERKDTPMIQNAGTLADQAFSGFSINAGPVAGDQPDPVNLVDSETGSRALEIDRQTTSEELLISGRSSDSYESCLIDEDAVVPNWLFQIISHQQSLVEESEPPELNPMPVPAEQPIGEPTMYDANGNAVEPGVGAGDGRGIHSDYSRDSSGRGTSLSSSVTSSDPQSEAILIDPFTGQLQLLREPSGNTIMIPEQPSDPSRPLEDAHNDTLSEPQEGPTRNRPPLVLSDVDADVSSIDTDVPDSSDN